MWEIWEAQVQISSSPSLLKSDLVNCLLRPLWVKFYSSIKEVICGVIQTCPDMPLARKKGLNGAEGFRQQTYVEKSWEITLDETFGEYCGYRQNQVTKLGTNTVLRRFRFSFKSWRFQFPLASAVDASWSKNMKCKPKDIFSVFPERQEEMFSDGWRIRLDLRTSAFCKAYTYLAMNVPPPFFHYPFSFHSWWYSHEFFPIAHDCWG